MNPFNWDTFEHLGISFDSREDAAALAAQLTEDLEVRIGKAIARGKSRALMAEFDQADEAAALAWLKRHQPDYREIVENVTADVRKELLIHRARLPGAKLLLALEQDATPVEELGLADLKKAGFQTAGEVVAILGMLPTSLDRRGVTRIVNRLWDHLMTKGCDKVDFPA